MLNQQDTTKAQAIDLHIKADRGAQIIKLATQLMAAGKSRGWSDALAQAKQQTKEAR